MEYLKIKYNFSMYLSEYFNKIRSYLSTSDIEIDLEIDKAISAYFDKSEVDLKEFISTFSQSLKENLREKTDKLFL